MHASSLHHSGQGLLYISTCTADNNASASFGSGWLLLQQQYVAYARASVAADTSFACHAAPPMMLQLTAHIDGAHDFLSSKQIWRQLAL